MNFRRTAALLLLVACSLVSTAPAKEAANKPYAGSAAPPLSPAEAQKKFKVPDGFEVRLFAAEPEVVNPVAMSFDEKGRLWVVEAYEYPYERKPGVKGRDRVICLEAPDGGERATKRTVVAEDLWLATAITFGNGGIYVGQAPDLYFYPITDTPDGPKAGERKTLLTGFGLEDKHELLNSFCWGPDGWLYMTQGVFTHSLVKDPANSKDPGVKFDAGVGRYNTHTRHFEVFADGISNQWGVDWDRYGNAFVSACVIDHIWHVVPGGVYVRQGGTPNVPYTYELLKSANKDHHRHYMAAYSGICIYQGDLFPEEYRGTAFMGNIHGNCIDHDKLTADGSSWAATDVRTAKDAGEFLEANDDWFRPVSEQVGPDGALWIMDWYDKYPCYQNSKAPDLDRERGRIWRVVYVGKEAGKAVPTHPAGMDWSKASGKELVHLLPEPNVWQRRTAQRLLNEARANGGLNDDTRSMLFDYATLGTEQPTEAQLSALWTLGSTGLADDKVLDLLAFGMNVDVKPTPKTAWFFRQMATVRAAAARITGEIGRGDEKALTRLWRLADDSDPRVLAEVAIAARRLAAYDTSDILAKLVHQKCVENDPQLPFLIWRAAEPKVMQRPTPHAGLGREVDVSGLANRRLRAQMERFGFVALPSHDVAFIADEPAASGLSALEFLQAVTKDAGNSPSAALLVRKSVRRLMDANDPAATKQAVDFINGLKDDRAAFASSALQGILDAQGGKKAAKAPAGADALDLARLQASKDAELSAAASRLAAVWGNAAAAGKALAALADPAATDDQRLRAAHLARQLDSDASRKALGDLLPSPAADAVKLEAIRGLGEIGNDASAGVILRSWKTYSPELRRSAIETLTSRLPWGKALLAAVQNKTVAASDVSAVAMRNLSRLRDGDFRQLLAKTLGTYREADPDKLPLIAAKKRAMLNGPVDLAAGKAVMQKTCLVCHSFYGEGAHVGPDLTGVGRSTIDALLHNVIDPNEIIGAGYENTIVETKDHRSISGRLVEDTADHVKLLSSGDKEDTVAKGEIASMRTEKISVMPEGLVDTMSDADLRNLLWYVYNPRADDKDHRLRIDLTGKKLIVSAKLPGSGEMVPLLDYATDPAGRPGIGSVRDPSGTLVLTADRGIHTDLPVLRAADDKPARQQFVRLLDLEEGNDRVGWKSLSYWLAAADGSIVLEEEQTVTVHAIDSPDSYRVDFDWTLRAKEKAVKLGGANDGGRRLLVDLSAGGAGVKTSQSPSADWVDVTLPLGDRMAGISVLTPATGAAPPIAPVSLGANKAWTGHYRVVVHAGPADPAKLSAEAKAFAATP